MVFLRRLRPPVANFVARQCGASPYEYALVASLFAVISLIVLVALAVIG
jgi:hypothetical protein